MARTGPLRFDPNAVQSPWPPPGGKPPVLWHHLTRGGGKQEEASACLRACVA